MATTTRPAASITLTDEQIDDLLTNVAKELSHQLRSPVLHDPSEAGLEYDNVFFPARDGVVLEGWFIPAANSDKLIIANHPMGFSRSGLPTQLEPWQSIWGPSGNTMEVDFIPDYKILHDAGYNVLCYDLRNHGLSGASNGGFPTSGLFEARDVVGSIDYARLRADTADMQTALFSRCLGCNSTFAAMTQFPDAFVGISSLVGPEPVTTKIIVGRQLALAGVPEEKVDSALQVLDGRLKVATSIDFESRDTREWAKHVNVPTFLYQVRDDVLTRPDDVQAMYDNIPLDDKQLRWILDSTRRWDGYLEFQRRPEAMLAWFEQHWS
jgi:uncharacterized protein